MRECLVDEESAVRSAAARAFDVLQEYVGPKAIDETIPTLLEALRQPGKGSGRALQALRGHERAWFSLHVRTAIFIPCLGSCKYRVPSTDTYIDRHAHDCVQCTGTGVFSHSRWKCNEQASFSYP